MIVKTGAIAEGLTAPMHYACGVVEAVYWAVARKKAVLTSGLDSHEQTPLSLHNKGDAGDFRVYFFTKPQVEQVVRMLKAILEPLGFDVVFEGNHIHIEWQPKGDEKIFIKEKA